MTRWYLLLGLVVVVNRPLSCLRQKTGNNRDSDGGCVSKASTQSLAPHAEGAEPIMTVRFLRDYYIPRLLLWMHGRCFTFSAFGRPVNKGHKTSPGLILSNQADVNVLLHLQWPFAYIASSPTRQRNSEKGEAPEDAFIILGTGVLRHRFAICQCS